MRVYSYKVRLQGTICNKYFPVVISETKQKQKKSRQNHYHKNRFFKKFSQIERPKRSIGFAEAPDRHCIVGESRSASHMGKCDGFRLHNDTYVSGEMARLFPVLQQLHKNSNTGKRTLKIGV